MQRYHDDFPDMLAGFDLATLEADPQSIFGLSADLAICYLNPGWFRFAKENEGEPAISERFGLGTPIASAIDGELQEFYLTVLGHVLTVGEVWQHDYECSTPDLYRLFHQNAYPMHNRLGLLVVNSLVTEQPHDASDRPVRAPKWEIYTNEHGLITQCSHCRRTRRAAQPDVWDWVPAWVRVIPPGTSHSLCPICYDYYWKHRPR